MTPRWRLFPKYALLIIALVGGMLIASGAIGIYFSWRDHQKNLIALQEEKAQSAATRIEQYILDIEHQLGWTALPTLDSGGSPLEQRRIEYLKLLRQTPAITEVAWLDATGREQLRISRLAMDAISGGADLSQEPKFSVANGGATYCGPVYFRKETEPYMTIARPAGSGGGVTAAEVNLKFVWDVVSRIKIGEAGLAYVVDASDTLVAHPDISLVLKKTDLKSLPQIKAISRPETGARGHALDLGGKEVLSAHAAIPTLHWTVFVESPEAEAFAPLYASIVRAMLLLGAGFLVSMVASFFVARALVRPLRALQEGAARIGAGELDRRIEVRTGDELESVAEQFNRMASDLKASYAGLERKVEVRTHELTESLEYQTAISEILQVMTSSPTDVQPVFDVIAERAMRLCDARYGYVFTFDGEWIRIGSVCDMDPAGVEAVARSFPMRPVGNALVARTVRDRAVVHVADVLGEPNYAMKAAAEVAGIRGALGVPMMREDQIVGVLVVSRAEVGVFSNKQVDLLKTFASQAVIAIENVRLFNETREALEQQTATAEVLQVIGSSVADTQPVFEKILQSCKHLFDSGEQGILLIGNDGRLQLGAHLGHARARLEAMFPLSEPGPIAASLRERRVMHYKDVLRDADVPFGVRMIAAQLGIGSYSQVFAPMIWEGRGVGSLYVTRQPPVGFSDKEIGLLKTFADQAAIAIQNARLFNETREALEQQTATAEILQVISSSVADAKPVFDTILDSCERLFSATGLGIYLIDDAGMLQKAGFRADRVKPLRAVAGAFPRPLEGTATELAIRERRVVHYPDVLAAPDVPAPLRRVAGATGNYSIAFAPMLWEGRGIGAIQVSRDPPNPFSDKELALLKTFADQAVIAIQNSRLFNEIQNKSRELESANKHKSEFLANMSHELRTPLNAIIGFSEVLSEKMFGDVNDKQLEYLLDIHTSGHHLLSLINDILDLSKIEAGRMELDLASVDLAMLLDNCTTLVRERANRQGLTLALDVEAGLGEWVVDVRKVKQIVVNLLSNAVKFTPAGGRVTLRARWLEQAIEIAVIDTGVGIAPDQQALVFEEFRQAEGDYLRKSEGTGLGLSLARRFVELHGGTIRVESEPGLGSTFAVTLPERVLEAV